MKINKEQRRKLWFDRVSQQKSSGQSQRKWCEEHGVNFHTFKNWCRKLKSSQPVKEQRIDFVTIRPKVDPAQSGVHLQLGDLRITVTTSTDLKLLRNVVQVLSENA